MLQSDFLRLLAYGVLLVGVWRAIGHAEFGRAVAEERARVAREIHDGLAQYLFAISTHVSMLESRRGARARCCRGSSSPPTAAQQEAQFAVLALSSASGIGAVRRCAATATSTSSPPTASSTSSSRSTRTCTLAPDEQIEVFRIVQEGLANVRKHAGAAPREVSIVQRDGRRVVRRLDDGTGFDGDERRRGPGPARTCARRAASIEGGFSLRSSPGPRHGDRGRPAGLGQQGRVTWRYRLALARRPLTVSVTRVVIE